MNIVHPAALEPVIPSTFEPTSLALRQLWSFTLELESDATASNLLSAAKTSRRFDTCSSARSKSATELLALPMASMEAAAVSAVVTAAISATDCAVNAAMVRRAGTWAYGGPGLPCGQGEGSDICVDVDG